MLNAEEEKFVEYWQSQRQRKKEFLKKISIGLPLVALFAVLFFINFLSGWFEKADRALRSSSSLLLIIMVAVIAIVVFVVVFSARHRWEQNEADYKSLLKKREGFASGEAESLS